MGPTFLHQEPVGAHTGLAHVAVLGAQSTLRRKLDIGIIEHNERRVAAQLQRDLKEKSNHGVWTSRNCMARTETETGGISGQKTRVTVLLARESGLIGRLQVTNGSQTRRTDGRSVPPDLLALDALSPDAEARTSTLTGASQTLKLLYKMACAIAVASCIRLRASYTLNEGCGQAALTFLTVSAAPFISSLPMGVDPVNVSLRTCGKGNFTTLSDFAGDNESWATRTECQRLKRPENTKWFAKPGILESPEAGLHNPPKPSSPEAGALEAPKADV